MGLWKILRRIRFSVVELDEKNAAKTAMAGGTAVSDSAAVMVENGSTWTLTGDCKISSLKNNGAIYFNGYAITLADGTILRQ